MKFKSLFVLVLLISSIQRNIYTQQKVDVSWADSLAGNWETVPNPLEASSLRFEFKPNKKFSYILSSEWRGTYKLEGTKLISSIFVPIMNKYKTDTTTVLIYADTLIQVGTEKGKETTSKMIRKSSAEKKDAGIVGTWILENENAEYSTISYTPSGTIEVKNILKSFNGSYSTKSDTLMSFSQGHLMFKNRFVIARGLLRIYSTTQSGPITLRRVDK
ncbi:MAG: hypothetical protein WCA84_15120 [Ignavibacteriaceae bacterium]